MCVCVCVCVCVAKPVAVELRCHATALIAFVVSPSFHSENGCGEVGFRLGCHGAYKYWCSIIL